MLTSLSCHDTMHRIIYRPLISLGYNINDQIIDTLTLSFSTEQITGTDKVSSLSFYKISSDMFRLVVKLNSLAAQTLFPADRAPLCATGKTKTLKMPPPFLLYCWAPIRIF